MFSLLNLAWFLANQIVLSKLVNSFCKVVRSQEKLLIKEKNDEFLLHSYSQKGNDKFYKDISTYVSDCSVFSN